MIGSECLKGRGCCEGAVIVVWDRIGWTNLLREWRLKGVIGWVGLCGY